MPIRKKSGSKSVYILTSPKTGKKLAQGSLSYVKKRAAAIAYFRGH